MSTPSPFALCLRRALATAVAALLLTLVFSWPLARYATRGIVYTAFEQHPGEPLSMVPGDHLQFLYHLWLAQDTFEGHTPLFHNLYEFNTGDDSERRDVTPYYLPFSAFFAVGSRLAGQAFGWNFAGLVSLWLTGLFAWALARRYSESETAAGLLALVPMAFPFTWVNLLSGSPTGFALMWVPVLLYGLDRWAGDGSAAGAAWAGAAVFFSEWSDTHVFFFGVLVSPFWVLFAWQYRNGWRWPARAEWRRLLVSAWPLFLFAALAAAKAWAVSRGLQETAVASGRTEGEVALFSVPMNTLWRSGGVSKIFVGWPALAVYAALALLAAWRLRRAPRSRAVVSLALLLVALAGIAVLAAGTANPFGPRAWKLLTVLVPPYGMIRQADKIFCLVPTLAMLAVALGVRSLPTAATPRTRRLRTILALAVALAVALSWQARHRPGICLVDAEQGAYAAVAADAAARGTEPRALVLPLWPGDSHLSSIYQHDASLYRIRMINGYRPTVRKKYYDNIFLPLDSLNLGWPSGDQLRLLRDCRADYILFHEDAFPEKVSSFPPGATLLNLLSNPRLELLARDKSVWAFRILEPLDNLDSLDNLAPLDSPRLPVLFPVRTWNWKNSITNGVGVVPGEAASSDCILHVAAPMTEPVTSRWIRVSGPYDWQWRFRARGNAELEWTTRDASGTEVRTPVSVASEAWTWYTLPVPLPPASENADASATRELTADFRILSGEADMDAVLLTSASDFPPARPGDACTLPAIAFFRSGYSDPADGSVTFLPANNPADEILYSRNLWLEPGPHRIVLDFDTSAPEGTLLGTLTLRVGTGSNAVETSCSVEAGRPAELLLDVPDNRFFRLAFRYTRAAPCTLRSVRFEHLEPAP